MVGRKRASPPRSSREGSSSQEAHTRHALAPRPSLNDVHTAEHIHGRLQNAILEQRLPPGTKLGEDKLAEIFGTSRPRIRQVLARLEHEQLVDIFPQRGAYVARPTPEQAKDVFEARRLLEPAVIARLLRSQAPEKLQRLRQHVRQEEAARVAGDVRAVIRLSGEFHVLLAELSGNSAWARAMRDLCAVTCLIISLYNAPTARSCRPDEHTQLVDALERNELARAQQLVVAHLVHIESELVLHDDGAGMDLEKILGGTP